jgi:hypothetical protein
MFKQEFENLIGFEVEWDIYTNWIEKKYMEFTGTKQEFVKFLKANGTVAGLRLIHSEAINRKIEREKAERRLEKIWRQIERVRWQIEKLNRLRSKTGNWDDYVERDKLWTQEYQLDKVRLQIMHSLYPNEPKYFEGRQQ